MRIVNFSVARNALKGILDQAVTDADFTVITRSDAPDAVVMSLDTFNSLMETVHLLYVATRTRFQFRSYCVGYTKGPTRSSSGR